MRPVQQSLVDPTLERPVGPIPMSVVSGYNADIIASIADLYLTGSVLDVTYGKGMWWTRFTPDPFTFHDLETVDGVNFCALPELDNSFDAVCFDPPYVPAGGSRTSGQTAGEKRFRESFGIQERRTDAGLQELIMAGLTECARVTNCWLLVKCMEFVSGGKFRDMPTDITNGCRALGLDKWDVIVHDSGTGPGGHNIWEPLRARRAHSYLLVFRKPGSR